jgi:hypothetical protein
VIIFEAGIEMALPGGYATGNTSAYFTGLDALEVKLHGSGRRL